MPDDLLQLYQEISELTHPACASSTDECANYKGKPFRCCEKKYCDIAAAYAASKGIALQVTGNPGLPFMSENGCTVPLHLRPICTLHVCTISFAAKSHIDHDEGKTRQYFDLRKRIEVCESLK